MTDPVADWRQPWMDDEWLEWWMSLDHSRCTQYLDAAMDLDTYYALPDYVKCRSFHCPDCGKSTGSQGHRYCPERKV